MSQTTMSGFYVNPYMYLHNAFNHLVCVSSECPPGFEMVGGRCLQKFSKMPHDDAKEMCESAGHGMLTPDTPEFFNAFMEWNQVQDMR